MENQIPFAGGAAENDLNGIDAAGIVLTDTYDFLIGGFILLQQFFRIQGGFEADRQAAARMSVECLARFP